MYVCQTALDDFRSILETLGGPEEKRRAEELLSDVTVVQDDPSDKSKNMPYSLKIRDRSKVSWILENMEGHFVNILESVCIMLQRTSLSSRRLIKKSERNPRYNVITRGRCNDKGVNFEVYEKGKNRILSQVRPYFKI